MQKDCSVDKITLCPFFFGMKTQSISFSKGQAFPVVLSLFTVFLHFFVLTLKIHSRKRCVLARGSHQLKCVQYIFKLKNIKPCPKPKRV